MLIELLILIQAEKTSSLLLEDLACLTQDSSIDYANEKIEFSTRIISSQRNLLEIIEKKSRDLRSSSYIIISDQFVVNKTENIYKSSQLLSKIEKLIKHAKSFCGLIGIFSKEVPTAKSIQKLCIDGYATFNHNDIESLRRELLKVVHRIWLKSPVVYHNTYTSSPFNSIVISSINSKDQLYECFRLREQVYEILGYISRKGNNEFETDCFDPVSFHFRAIDKENSNKTVGTMRLIVPGLSSLINYTHPNLTRPNADWFNEITDQAFSISLPVFQNFLYFLNKKQKKNFQDDCIRSKEVCEISRVIVSPEYRGMGISRLLMNHALNVAKLLQRRYIWLECTPRHIEMYKKYGFEIKSYGDEIFYKRVQRFDTWAVAMFLDLNQGNKLTYPSGSSITYYHLPIDTGRAKNYTLRFQYYDQPVNNIKKIFEQSRSVNGKDTSLKELIQLSLTRLEIEQFVSFLESVYKDLEPEKLSLINNNGRNHVFDPSDIKFRKRDKILKYVDALLG